MEEKKFIGNHSVDEIKTRVVHYNTCLQNQKGYVFCLWFDGRIIERLMSIHGKNP